MNDREAPPAEPAPPPMPTVREHLLVRQAGHLLEPIARRLAKRYSRFVHESGLMTVEDLISIGQEGLFEAARAYDPRQRQEFAPLARTIARFRMLDALHDLLFHERLDRAAAKAEDNYAAFYADNDYDVMKHDEEEAKRRYRAFARHLLAATFAASLEEAKRSLDALEGDLRGELAHAVKILNAAVGHLAAPDRDLLALVYRDHVLLKDAAARLGIPYGTVRARHARVLKVLHELLMAEGIRFAPRPLVAPDAGDVFGTGATPENDTGALGSP